MKITPFHKLVKRIEKSNDKFQAATKAQRIVMVSKDVLAMLELNRMKAHKGFYVKMPQLSALPEDTTCQLQDILKMPDLPTCEVCAIGAGMLASTLRLNQVEVSTFDLRNGSKFFTYTPWSFSKDMSQRAMDVFSRELLCEMEKAFEGGWYNYRRLRVSSRLVAIYQNLIDNKGEKFTFYQNPSKVVVST
jgi:hypothetical protein